MMRRNSFTQPVSRLSIPCQARRPDTNGMTYGRKNNVRKIPDAAEILAAEDERNGERDNNHNRQVERRESERDRERIPGLPVGQHPLEVLEPHEPQRLVVGEADVRDAEDERRDHRKERERQEADDPGRQEDEAPSGAWIAGRAPIFRARVAAASVADRSPRGVHRLDRDRRPRRPPPQGCPPPAGQAGGESLRMGDARGLVDQGALSQMAWRSVWRDWISVSMFRPALFPHFVRYLPPAPTRPRLSL